MNGADYIEMKGCEQLLEKIGVEIYEGGWEGKTNEAEIIKKFLSERYKYYKDQT